MSEPLSAVCLEAMRARVARGHLDGPDAHSRADRILLLNEVDRLKGEVERLRGENETLRRDVRHGERNLEQLRMCGEFAMAEQEKLREALAYCRDCTGDPAIIRAANAALGEVG